MARLPSLALSGDDLTGAAAPGTSPWAQGPDTPVLPAAGIISDPNVMWLDPGMLMEPGTGFGSAQKADILGQAINDASSFLQPRGSGGGGGGGGTPRPVGGQATGGAGGIELPEGTADKVKSLFGSEVPGLGEMDYNRIAMATSPEAFDAMNALRRAKGAPDLTHYTYDERLGMALPHAGAPVGLESWTPGQLPGGMSPADLFDPFPAGATAPPMGAGADAAMASNVSGWATGAGALLAALGYLIGGEAGEALSLAGTGASTIGGLSGAAGATGTGLSAAMAGLSGVAAVPALGAALHPFFAKAAQESPDKRQERRGTTEQGQLMQGVGDAISQTTDLNQLLALAGAGDMLGHGQLQFTHDQFGHGGDYATPMSDAWLSALMQSAGDDQALGNFIKGVNIKAGQTGATEVNPALTDLYRRQLAHAGGLTDVEGLFSTPLDRGQLTQEALNRMTLMAPQTWTTQGYQTDYDAMRQAANQMATQGITRAYQPLGEQYGTDVWTPVSQHYRQPGEMGADMAQIQAFLADLENRMQLQNANPMQTMVG